MKNKIIVGFRINVFNISDTNENKLYKNIVPLDDMTDKQLYDFACADKHDNTIVYDDIEEFVYHLNTSLISPDDFRFYVIKQ